MRDDQYGFIHPPLSKPVMVLQSVITALGYILQNKHPTKMSDKCRGVNLTEQEEGMAGKNAAALR